MEQLSWSDDLKIGVEIIDNQHKVFFEIIDELRDATLQGELGERLAPILEKLHGYTQFHFATEEKYFLEFDYVGADDHVAEHKRLKNHVEGMIEDQETEGEKIARELPLFLATWLFEHIKGQDAKFVKCFNDHGLK